MPRSRFNHKAFKFGVMYLILFLLAFIFYLRSCPPETAEHDVFLNFRGADVRDTFLGHLHDALLRNSVKPFLDEDNLRRGESSDLAFTKAITGSRLALIIFSKNYAFSTWCLDELDMIVNLHGSRKRAFPIFYGVNPSDVMHQTGVFAQAFAEHKENFKHTDKVFLWKIALSRAAKLHGWDSEKIKPEANLIKKVVQEISRKLALLTSPTSREKITQGAGYVLLFVLGVVIFFFKSRDDDDQSSETPEHYDVFVNYYGEETLVSELYDALDNKGLTTFKDKGRGRGTEFTKEIQDAIVRSKVAVIIFTKCFAESTGCLDALVKIMELHRETRVVPVYYHVDRSDLRWSEGSFATHEERWRGEEKVNAWKNAMKRAYVLPAGEGEQGQGETFIDAIVRDIMKKLVDCNNNGRINSSLM